MSLTRLTTDQYTDKSVTSEKLADNISINNLTTPSIKNGNCGISIGNSLTKNGSQAPGSGGILYKYSGADMIHMDNLGNLYVKGNLLIEGELNSTTTTVNTMEIADYEIILNASVTTPYASGGRLTINRGGANYDPYIEWNETNKLWQVSNNGSTSSRIVDLDFADSRYVNTSGDSMTGPLTVIKNDINGGVMLGLYGNNQDFSLRIGHDSSQSSFDFKYTGTESGAYNSLELWSDDGGRVFRVQQDSILRTDKDLIVGGDLTVTGNKITFGNGSYISNETDAIFEVTGDGQILLKGSSTGDLIKIGATDTTYKVAADALAWLEINSNRKIGFGPGNTSRDTWLYRNAASSLKTEGNLIVDGSIGIGTENPSQKLEVAGVIKSQQTIIDNITSANYNEGLRINGAANTWRGVFLGGPAGSTGGADTNLWSLLRDNNNNFRITSNLSSNAIIFANQAGKVGIRTTDPQETLHINGNVRGGASGGSLRISTGTGYIDIGPQNSSHAHIKTDRSSFYFDKKIFVSGGTISSYAEDLTLQSGASGTSTTRITVKNDTGKVGIGATDPAEMLEVVGSTKTQGVKIADSSRANKFEIKYDATTKSLSFNFIG